MKIVFMGTPDFAVGALEALVEAGHEVVAVVTQPDKPKGRGKEMQQTPVKVCALKHNIEVFQPVKIKHKEAVEVLRGYGADLFVVAAFGQILGDMAWIAKETVLADPTYFTWLDVPYNYVFLFTDSEYLGSMIWSFVQGAFFAVLGGYVIIKKSHDEDKNATLHTVTLE